MLRRFDSCLPAGGKDGYRLKEHSGAAVIMKVLLSHPFASRLSPSDVMLTGPPPPGSSGNGNNDGDGDYTADGELQPRRRRQAKAPTPEASEQRRVEPPSPQWNAGWFRDAQQADQSGVFSWARRCVEYQ